MNKAVELFDKILVDGQEISLASLDANNGIYSVGQAKANKQVNVKFVLKNKNTIPAYLFSGLSYLKSVTIPESVTTIGAYAFARTHATVSGITNKLTSIGDGAFDDVVLDSESVEIINNLNPNSYVQRYTAEEAAIYNAGLPGAISTDDWKVEPVEGQDAVEAVEGVKYTQEEIDAAAVIAAKTTDDWKVEPVEGQDAVEAVEGVKYTQEEIDAAAVIAAKTTNDWKVEPVEAQDAVYSFESFGDAEATQANKYGEGTVEVTDLRADGATVKVLTNEALDENAEDFVGQEFNVNSLDENEILQLFKPEEAQPIYVKVNDVYSFTSYGDAEATQANKYGEGKVKVIETRDDGATVEVIENTDFGNSGVDFVGQQFNVNSLDESATLQLFSTEGLAQQIWVTVKYESEPQNAIYSFTSYSDNEAQNTYATGIVEVTELRNDGATVKVLTNSVEGFVGQLFNVNSLDENAILQLFSTEGLAQQIWVTVHKESDAKNAIYAFDSFGSTDDNASKYGYGTVEVIERGEEVATVKVLTNTDLGNSGVNFVGQEFNVHSLNTNNKLQLFKPEEALPIWVTVHKESDAVEAVEGVKYTQEEIDAAAIIAAKTTNDWKVEPVEGQDAVEAVEGVKYTQEEIDAAAVIAAKTTDDWKVEPVEGQDAVEAVEGVKYTQEEIDAAAIIAAKTTDDWKVEPVEAKDAVEAVEGVKYTQEEVDTYNAKLDGAVHAGDIK